MNPLILEEYQSLFRDEASFGQFVSAFTSRLNNDYSPVICENEVIGTVLSPQASKEVLYERVIRRIADKPEILDTLRDRLENDEIVD